MKKDNEKILGSVGGEALMEGIMMRGPKGAAVSLRLPNGTIETSLSDAKMPKDKYKILGWPLIRGPVNLIYSMIFGYKCLMKSAEKMTEGMMDEAEESTSKLDKWLEDHMGPKMMAVIGVIGSVLGIGLAMGLFVFAPEYLVNLIKKLAGEADLSRYIALISGGIRVVLFVLYMLAMSYIKDIRRVFQYHGAEHKTIFCYEAGLDLTVENVRRQSRLHPRCGTSFMFLMILLSICVSGLVYAIFPGLAAIAGVRVGLKFLQFPIIMAVGYEFIRFAGQHLKNPIVRAISFPGLCMQRITTKEPDDSMIEVGIAALNAAVGNVVIEDLPAPEPKIEGTDTIAGDFDTTSDGECAGETEPQQ